LVIELHKLEHFVELARSGSYTRAAEQLRLSQPALSRSIQALERDIGTSLFERARGSAVVRTTEAGHALLPRAQDLLSRAHGLEDDLMAARLPRARTQIAFGVAPLLGSVLLADHEDLVRLHDFGDITVSMGTPELLMEQVDAGDVAFAIGVAPAHGTPPRVAAELLGLTSPRIFVREGHPLLDGTAPALADLRRYTRVSSVKWNQNVTLQLEDPGDASAVRASICIDSFDVLADLALHADAVLFSNFRPLHTGLVELALAQRLDVRQNEIMLFSRRGWRLRPEEIAVRDWLRDRCAMLLLQGASSRPLLRQPTAFDGEGVPGDE
jgi:DNA-binding transcriptional LysR family regulator